MWLQISHPTFWLKLAPSLSSTTSSPSFLATSPPSFSSTMSTLPFDYSKNIRSFSPLYRPVPAELFLLLMLFAAADAADTQPLHDRPGVHTVVRRGHGGCRGAAGVGEATVNMMGWDDNIKGTTFRRAFVPAILRTQTHPLLLRLPTEVKAGRTWPLVRWGGCRGCLGVVSHVRSKLLKNRALLFHFPLSCLHNSAQIGRVPKVGKKVYFGLPYIKKNFNFLEYWSGTLISQTFT